VLSGSGNKLGTSADNRIPIADFNAIASFPASYVTVDIEYSSTYDSFQFDKGNYVVTMASPPAAGGTQTINNLVIDDNSHVDFQVGSLEQTLYFKDISLDDKSTFNLVSDATEKKLKVNTDNINNLGGSQLNVECGVFGMPLSGSGTVKCDNRSHINLSVQNSTYTNSDGRIGFGVSLLPLDLDEYSYLTVDCANTNNLNMHIGGSSTQDNAVDLSHHSHWAVSSGMNQLSTSSTNKKFVGSLHSSMELDIDISTTGPTSFDEVELELFSTFGSPLSGGELTETLTESFVYQI
jgi:hypothetical protein